MEVSPSPNLIPCDWLGLKHQLTNYFARISGRSYLSPGGRSIAEGRNWLRFILSAHMMIQHVYERRLTSVKSTSLQICPHRCNHHYIIVMSSWLTELADNWCQEDIAVIITTHLLTITITFTYYHYIAVIITTHLLLPLHLRTTTTSL